jgi:uncharacterized protein YdaU (DUF1376 family)
MATQNDKVYEPKYLYWWQKDFSADPYVSRVMRSLHRHFYRALIIESCFNSCRPYLPNDDEQLWMLADAESPEQWLAHKDVVMRKFTLTADGKYWQHKRVLADWQLMLDAHAKNVEKGRKGGKKKASNNQAQSGPASSEPGLATAQPSRTTARPSTLTDYVLDFDSDFDSTKNLTENELLTDGRLQNEQSVSQSPVCSSSESSSTKSKATPLTPEQAERLARADERNAKLKADKARWEEFRMNEDNEIPDSMRYALPEDKEYEQLLAQLDEIGVDEFCEAVSEWESMQSPPISGLKFHRWRIWLETCAAKLNEYR